MIAQNKYMTWGGWFLSGLVVAALIFSASMKFMQPKEFVEGMGTMGWPVSLGVGLGITELVCTILYAIPQTSVLGAILLTGYLGGATATHLRIGDPYFAPIVVGVVVWLGLCLREGRLWSLIPLRK